VFTPDRLSDKTFEELRLHPELLTQAASSAGMSRDDARLAEG
jgi:hypothetical protein